MGAALRCLFVGLAAALAVLLALGLAGCANAGGGSANGSVSPAASDDKVKVVASFYAMADFAQKVGGDHVEVTNLVPAGTEPHDWEPTPSDMAALQDADLLVYNGAGMEHWVDDTLAALGDAAPAAVRASDGIALLDEKDHDADDADADAHDHDADDHDPHVWLNPANAKAELKNIADALGKADPSHADDYSANYERWAAEFDGLDQEFKAQLTAAPHKTIVVSHEAFGYLCDAYGLTQLPITGMDAEGEPDAQAMAQIIDQVRAQNIKVIFSEDLVSPKVAQQIADATGATCETLNPLEGLTDDQLAQGADYVQVMRENLAKLVKALA